MKFTDINQTLEFNGFEISAEIEGDSDHGAPWDECDGHGPVSEWRRASMSYGYASKKPGELLLCTDHGSARFYDFAEACKIARRDGWGVSPYKIYTERGAYGLIKLSGHWFDARNNLTDISTDWHDDINAAMSALYAAHRATMSAREYAAQAALQDYNRLREWCTDQWEYVGIIVTATDDDGNEVASDSLWGIESDSDSYLLEVANELFDQLRDSLPLHREMIAADIGI